MKPETKQIIRIIFAIISIILIMLLYSCEKEPIVPGSYVAKPEKQDSIIPIEYIDGGTLPNFGNNLTPNEISGSRWVLTFLQIGFSTPPLPIDTVYFVDNTHYTINSGSNRTYQFYSGVSTSSKTLTLNYHYPFGSGNYTGQIAPTFMTDSLILNTEFTNTNTSTITVKASFKRI